MKLSHLSSEPFKNSLNKLLSAPLPPKTAFQLKKLTQKLEEDLKIFEDMRNAIVQEYCAKDENGNPVQNDNGTVNLDISKADEWQPKVSELMSLETSFEIPKVSLDSLGDKIELSATDLFVLGDLITE